MVHIYIFDSISFFKFMLTFNNIYTIYGNFELIINLKNKKLLIISNGNIIFLMLSL